MDLDRILKEIEADMSGDVAGEFVRVAADYFSNSRLAQTPVSTRKRPAELAALFEGDFPAEPTSLADVLGKVERDVVAESNWLYHPRYMGHQVTAPLPAAVWTDMIVSALNQSLAVQEMSPAITMVERQIIRWMCRLAGFSGGGGTLTSGGTEATFTALLAARAALLPNAWEDGLTGELPIILCGEHSHYAVTRAAAELGLGLKRAVAVRSDNFRMDVADLASKVERAISSGQKIMAVIATAGSTATGSFDDLNAIADLCDEHGIWLHVDGAHGASALLSDRHRHRLAGVERARSVAWDPHKMMRMPLSVGVLLVRDERDLDRAFRQNAPYLFVGGENWDQGGRSFQCSRRSDALKLWVALQRYGTRAFGVLYDHFADLSEALYDVLESNPRFEVFHRPECNILCFRYRGDVAEEDLDDFNLRLRTAYNTSGTGWITTTQLNRKRVLRTTLINPRITREHLAAMLAELEEVAARLTK